MTRKQKEQRGTGEGPFSLGEAQRQIAALWKRNSLLEEDMRANTKDIQAVAMQMPYVVALLEKIDKAQAEQIPNCAARGVRLNTMEDDVSKLTVSNTALVARVGKLENTNNILKWINGVMTTIFTGAVIIKVSDFFNK